MKSSRKHQLNFLKDIYKILRRIYPYKIFAVITQQCDRERELATQTFLPKARSFKVVKCLGYIYTYILYTA